MIDKKIAAAPGIGQTAKHFISRGNSNSNYGGGKQLPPYGRRLQVALSRSASWPDYSGTSRDGKHVSLYLILGSGAWKRARKAVASRTLFLMLPPGEDPTQYDWSLLAGHDPIITLVEGVPPTEDEYNSLAAALVLDGVTRFLRSAGGDGRAVRHLSREVVRWAE